MSIGFLLWRYKMKIIKTITKYDFRTLKYCNLYLMKYKRKSYLISYVFAAIALGLAVYTYVTNKEQLFFAIVFVLLAALMIFQGLTLEKKLERNLERYFFDKPVHEQMFFLSDEKVGIARDGNPENLVEYEWAYVNEIHAIPQFYLIFLTGFRAPLVIDRSEDALLEGTKEELEELLKEKSAGKPYKELNKDIVSKPVTFVHTYVEPVKEEEMEMEHLVKEEEDGLEAKESVVLEGEIVEDEQNVEE